MLLELQVTHSPNCIPKVLLFRLPSIWAEVFTYFMTCVFYILNNVTEFPFISILSYAYSFPVLCFCQSIPSLRGFYCRLSQLLPPLISVRLVYTLYWIVELFLSGKHPCTTCTTWSFNWASSIWERTIWPGCRFRDGPIGRGRLEKNLLRE